MGLATVEARHAGWLNTLLGQSLVPDFAQVEAPISQTIELSRVAEFVTDSRSTLPAFDPTIATNANGLFVLDFIQFLEYIESTFYALNVPRLLDYCCRRGSPRDHTHATSPSAAATFYQSWTAPSSVCR